MMLRLLSVLLAAFLAGEVTSPIVAQPTRQRREPPPAQFNDFDDFRDDDFDDDDRDFRHRPHPSRSQDVRDEEDGDLWLYVIIILVLAGGGGGWFWWDHFDGDSFGD